VKKVFCVLFFGVLSFFGISGYAASVNMDAFRLGAESVERAQEERRYQRQLELQQRELELRRQQFEHQQKLDKERREYLYLMEIARQEEERMARIKREEELLQQRIAEENRIRVEEERERNAISTGSGFIVSKDGYVITNSHVVSEKTNTFVRDRNGRFFIAKLRGVDLGRDLAILKIDGNFMPLKIVSTSAAKKGQKIFVIGYPLPSVQGGESKITDGIISSFSGLNDDQNWFQISAPIQGGNSGGPLVNESGDVIGVIVASANSIKFQKIAGNIPQNVNFAIKSNVLLEYLSIEGVRLPTIQRGKISLDLVDQATVMVIAKNGPLDFLDMTKLPGLKPSKTVQPIE
jgi:S1-C subfamily serine protease